jgi:hypothetical protein
MVVLGFRATGDRKAAITGASVMMADEVNPLPLSYRRPGSHVR